MKAIFDAIRRSKELRAAPENLLLRMFESSNRGHSNKLDEFALEITTRQNGHYFLDSRISEQDKARIRTTQDSLQTLLYYMLNEPESRFESAYWDEILDARDDTGLLQRTALIRIQNWSSLLGYESVRQSKLNVCQATFKDGTITLNMTFTHGRLRADRQFSFSGMDLSTLRGALKAIRYTKNKAASLLAQEKDFPEFAPAVLERDKADRISRKIGELIRLNLSAEERDWLRANPTALKF